MPQLLHACLNIKSLHPDHVATAVSSLTRMHMPKQELGAPGAEPADTLPGRLHRPPHQPHLQHHRRNHHARA